MDGGGGEGGAGGGGGGETPDDGGLKGARWFCNGLLRFCLETFLLGCIHPKSGIVL